MMTGILIVLCVGLVLLQIRFNLFALAPTGLRVLMYHKVDQHIQDNLTVSVAQLKQHLIYLKQSNYSFITLSELQNYLQTASPLPNRAVLLTFDDGYVDNLTHLLPLLEEFNLKAAVFLPVAFLGKTNGWDQLNDPIMNETQLRGAKQFFEYGLHSFLHQNLPALSPEEFRTDLRKCVTKLKEQQVPFLNFLAYPYGKFPKDSVIFNNYEKVMREEGILGAFRIGNKINALPMSNRYLIKRIDIKGTDSFWEFKMKVAKGRVKMF